MTEYLAAWGFLAAVIVYIVIVGPLVGRAAAKISKWRKQWER